MKRVLGFASYLIGRIAVRLGGPGPAISWFRTAVRFQESSTRSLSWLGWSLAEAGAIEEAAAVYDNLVKRRPADARSWLGLAQAEQELGEHIDALSALDHAIALERQNPVLHYTRGHSLIALGRVEEAASAYRLAVNIEPSYADAAGALGAALGRLRRWDEAVRWDMEALRITANVDIEYNLGVALYELHRFGEAEQAFRRVLQDEPSSGEVQAYLALSVAAQGTMPAAINMLEAILNSNPADTSVLTALSSILLSEGKTSDALHMARDAVKAGPNDPRAYVALGWAYLMTDQEVEALRAFDTARQMEPESPEIDAARGCCFSRMGRHHEALEAFQQVIARDPEYLERDEMASLCFERSRHEVRS